MGQIEDKDICHNVDNNKGKDKTDDYKRILIYHFIPYLSSQHSLVSDADMGGFL